MEECGQNPLLIHDQCRIASSIFAYLGKSYSTTLFANKPNMIRFLSKIPNPQMTSLLPYILIGLVASTPIVFWIYVRRFFGERTHPVALFGLSWMTVSLLLGAFDRISFWSAILSTLWIIVSFCLLAVRETLRRAKTRQSEDLKSKVTWIQTGSARNELKSGSRAD